VTKVSSKVLYLYGYYLKLDFIYEHKDYLLYHEPHKWKNCIARDLKEQSGKDLLFKEKLSKLACTLSRCYCKKIAKNEQAILDLAISRLFG
jgi:hypothetical protein